MLATVNQEHGAGHCAGPGEPGHCIRDLTRPARCAQGGHAVRQRKLVCGLIARWQGNARGHCQHSQGRGVGLRTQTGGLQQTRFRQGVGEEIRIGIGQFLIEYVNDHAEGVFALSMAGRESFEKHASQHDGADEVVTVVREKGIGLHIFRPIEFKAGCIVDDAVQMRERRKGLFKHCGDFGGLPEIRLHAGALPAKRLHLVREGLCLCFGATVMQGQIPAIRSHPQRNLSAKPNGCSGDKGSPRGRLPRTCDRWGVSGRLQHGPKCSFDNLHPMSALSAHIARMISQAGGWIGFDCFMQAALYTPALGYYSGGGAPFRDRGDFITAPMLGPWLARAIHDWSAPLRGPDQPWCIREFGGGRGDLAAALIDLAQREGIAADVEMIELSADLRELQRQSVAHLVPRGPGGLRWSDHLVPGFRGLVLANEVLDAMPVRCFEWAGGDDVLEWGVGVQGDDFIWASQPADAALAAEVLVRRDAAGARGLEWSAGYRGEVCSWIAPWMAGLAEATDRAAVLLIDYGHGQPERDHPGRTSGTLCAHHGHRRFDEPRQLLARPGEQDLTAHVDFTGVALAARRHGFHVDGFVTQSRFLIAAGVLDHARALLESVTDAVERTRLLHQLQQLLSEAAMGEVFKVMLLTRGLDESTRAALRAGAFVGGDRMAALDLQEPAENSRG